MRSWICRACLIHDLPGVCGQRAIRARLEVGFLHHLVGRILQADASRAHHARMAVESGAAFLLLGFALPGPLSRRLLTAPSMSVIELGFEVEG